MALAGILGFIGWTVAVLVGAGMVIGVVLARRGR